jgi:hypothetical protein
MAFREIMVLDRQKQQLQDLYLLELKEFREFLLLGSFVLKESERQHIPGRSLCANFFNLSILVQG